LPRKIELSRDDEQRFKSLWNSGTPVADICTAFGLSHDAVNRVRGRLELAPRTARTRAAPRVAMRDPSPEEIAAACAELRAKHMAKRLAEPTTRKYRDDNETGLRMYPCDVFDLDG